MTRIKIRRILKKRIMELYPEVISAVTEERKIKKQFSLKLTGNEQKLVNILRSKIGYSCKTNDFDILYSFLRMVKE